MAYKWPTDGPMALPKHSISWEQHVANQKAKGATTVPDWAGGAPIPPAAPVAQPQPVDPAFEQAKLTASRNIALSNSEGAYQTGNLNFDYGYNSDGTVNTANPYSRAALYQLDYENNQRGTTNSMAARGQLYSGALINQQGINSSNYARNEAGNRLAYQRGLHAIQAGRLGTMAENSLGVGQEDYNALNRAVYPGT